MTLITEKVADIRLRAAVLLGYVGIMWGIRAFDSLHGSPYHAAIGIIPRTWAGLPGIILAPFIHASWDHLIANSLPLLILGSIILAGSIRQFVIVVLLTTLIGGAGTWLFGSPHSEHIGASGVVFGFVAFLLFRSAFDRRVSSFVVTLIVAVVYGGAVGLAWIPRAGISWSGHIFGFLGGIVAARFMHEPAQRVFTAP